MSSPAGPGPEDDERPLVVLGDGALARSVCAGLVERGRLVRHLPAPDDAGMRDLWLELPGRGLVRWDTTSRDRCQHLGG